MSETSTLESNRILGDLTHNELLALQDLFNPRFAINNVFGVILHVAAIEHGIFRRANIDESRFHSGQNILHLADINVAVNLRDIISQTAHVMLNQTSAFHHCNLCEIVTNLNSHEVATDWTSVALASFATFNNSRI